LVIVPGIEPAVLEGQVIGIAVIAIPFYVGVGPGNFIPIYIRHFALIPEEA
jgi:hypothetical protein